MRLLSRHSGFSADIPTALFLCILSFEWIVRICTFKALLRFSLFCWGTIYRKLPWFKWVQFVVEAYVAVIGSCLSLSCCIKCLWLLRGCSKEFDYIFSCICVFKPAKALSLSICSVIFVVTVCTFALLFQSECNTNEYCTFCWCTFQENQCLLFLKSF